MSCPFRTNIFFERYQFLRESIIYLNNILSPHIPRITQRGHAFSSEQMICSALRFYANGSFLYDVGDSENPSKPTVCRAVRNVTVALKQLLYSFVVFPSHRPTRLLKDFHRTAGFPDVIGCIDGTHIPITAPSPNEEDYIICDAAHLISNVEAKWPGSVHDSCIFRECTLSAKLARGEYNGYLLGDGGYTCQPYLLTPYLEPEPGQQHRYNVAHSRPQARVEITIGMPKARFRCLRILRVSPERACDIIVACVILHNIATIRGENCPIYDDVVPDEDVDHADDMREGQAVRDEICHNNF